RELRLLSESRRPSRRLAGPWSARVRVRPPGTGARPSCEADVASTDSLSLPPPLPHMADVHDPHLVIAYPVIETIRKAADTKAPEFRRSINCRPGVWKMLQQLDRSVDRMLEGPRRLWISGMKIGEYRFNVGTRPRRVPNSHRPNRL